MSGGKITSDELSIELKEQINGVAKYKNGSGVFPSMQDSVIIEDDFITDSTMITIIPTDEKIGCWTVESFDGNFVVTTDISELKDVPFTWGGVK